MEWTMVRVLKRLINMIANNDGKSHDYLEFCIHTRMIKWKRFLDLFLHLRLTIRTRCVMKVLIDTESKDMLFVLFIVIALSIPVDLIFYFV